MMISSGKTQNKNLLFHFKKRMKFQEKTEELSLSYKALK